MHFVLQSTGSHTPAFVFSKPLPLQQLASISELIVELALNTWFLPGHPPRSNECRPDGLQGF